MYKELKIDYERKLSWAKSLGIGTRMFSKSCLMSVQFSQGELGVRLDSVETLMYEHDPVQIPSLMGLIQPFLLPQSCPHGSTSFIPTCSWKRHTGRLWTGSTL